MRRRTLEGDTTGGSEPRARLELIRSDTPGAATWPDAFAVEICDDLCSAVDEALTLEEALRKLLRIVCDRLRWNAGRAQHHQTPALWFVDSHETIRTLRRTIALPDPDRTIVWHEPWTTTQHRGLWKVVFPIEWATGACLEFYSTELLHAPDAALEHIACALVPAGALLRRKRAERSQHAANVQDRSLFLDSPAPCFVVSTADLAIRLANEAASTSLGYSPDELVAMSFDALLCGNDRALPPPGKPSVMRQRRRDGREILVEVRSRAHELDDGTSAMIVIANDVTDRLLTEQRLEAAAATDALTGLQNRASFDRHLALAVERALEGALFALLFIDLDRFKGVNDTYGHMVGDALLCEVARRLRCELRSGDLAARLGGDEFVVLLPLRDLAEAIPVAERVQGALAQPCRVGGTDLVPSGSIGVAFAGPHSTTAAALMHEADDAMYRAKAKGPGNVAFASFATGMKR